MPKKAKKVQLPALHIYRKIAVSFFVLTILLISLIFYFSGGKATITVYPDAEEISSEFTIKVYGSNADLSSEDGVISGKILDTELEATSAYPATGLEVAVGEILGTATIYNDRAQSQVLVATTRLLSPDEILFRIKKRVDIPAKDSVEVEIYPDDPASIPAQVLPAKWTIPGLSGVLQELVYAETKKPILKEGEKVKVISKDDLVSAEDDLLNSLSVKALAEFEEQTESLELGSPELGGNLKAVLVKKELSSTEHDSLAGEQKEEFSSTMKMKITGVILNTNDVLEIAKKKLSEALPSSQKIVGYNLDDFTYEARRYNLDENYIELKVYAMAKVVPSEKSSVLAKKKLAGKTKTELEAYFKQFKEIKKIDTHFSPIWVSRTPKDVDKINVEIKVD